MTSTQVALQVSLASLSLAVLWRLIRRPEIRHPPSPSSLPFIGNALSIPSGHEYIAFAKLGEQLNSDIVYLEIIGHKIIVLNSTEAALDLLEKRSAVYSDRPPLPMVKDPALMNWSGLPSVVGYNDLWRHYRRMMNNWLNPRMVTQFDDLQERQARLLLQRLLNVMTNPEPFENVRDEFFYAMACSIFELAYGYRLQGPEDRFFKQEQRAFHNVTVAGMQTNFLVNIFPALSYIPDWLPGTGWKRTAREWREQQIRAKTEPYEWTKAQVSANFLVSLVAAMVLNPHVQAKAQNELDAVLGHGVLPRISDKEKLPYIMNLIDEVLRLYPVVPLGVPHASFQDDNYRGYDIQKGTTVLGNAWAIGRDPRHYTNPEVFDPDRYLDPNVPRTPAFGWGRRKCPGIHFAETSVFITTALLLSTFTFSKKRDSSGKEIEPQIELEHNAIVLALKPFGFEFKPRSDVHYQLILGDVGE